MQIAGNPTTASIITCCCSSGTAGGRRSQVNVSKIIWSKRGRRRSTLPFAALRLLCGPLGGLLGCFLCRGLCCLLGGPLSGFLGYLLRRGLDCLLRGLLSGLLSCLPRRSRGPLCGPVSRLPLRGSFFESARRLLDRRGYASCRCLLGFSRNSFNGCFGENSRGFSDHVSHLINDRLLLGRGLFLAIQRLLSLSMVSSRLTMLAYFTSPDPHKS